MTRYEVVEPTEEHLRQVIGGMRKADRDEVWASHKQTPEQAVRISTEVSRDTARAGLADGKAIMVFGVATNTFFSLEGWPWMLATDDLEVHWRAFLKGSIQWVDEVKWDYQRMVNFVDARNTKSIKWLKLLGFTVYPAAPYGYLRLPFHKFELTRPEPEECAASPQQD